MWVKVESASMRKITGLEVCQTAPTSRITRSERDRAYKKLKACERAVYSIGTPHEDALIDKRTSTNTRSSKTLRYRLLRR